MNLSSIGEDALIQRLTAELPLGKHIVKGPGDDCAVLPGKTDSDGREWYQLFKTDCVVEGVHFEADTLPEQVGWKAVARTVSDIGAMGGIPSETLVTLVMPASRSVEYVDGLYTGIGKCAETFGLSIVGGETSGTAKGSDSGIISIAMLGMVESEKCAFRSGGVAGDSIYVTGRLGGSIGGWHLSFIPRAIEARWLAVNWPIHAMMDLSDGLAKDLPRLAAASKLGFNLFRELIPCREGCSLDEAMGDGEDYELLFTCPAENDDRLQSQWSAQFPKLALTKIGILTDEAEVSNWSGGHGSGWDHFRGDG